MCRRQTHHLFAVAAGVAVMLLSAAPAGAQRVLFSSFDGVTRTTAYFDVRTGQVTPIAPDGSLASVFTSDGEYLVRVAQVGDRVETRVRHVPSGVEAALGIAFSPVVAHPRALAIFGTVGGALARLDPSGLSSWSPCGVGVSGPFQLSVDGTRLFSLCPSGHFLVVDSESGVVVRDTTIGAPDTIHAFVASPDGTEIVVVRALTAGSELARLDAVSGTTLRARPLNDPVAVSGRLFAIPGGARLIEADFVLAAPGSAGYDMKLVDFNSLDVLPGLVTPRALFPSVAVGQDGRHAFVNWSNPLASAPYSRVNYFDLSSGALLFSASAPSLSVAAVAALPGAPASVAATVTGRTVSLTWQLPALSPAATGYRLAIGTTAGASNLGSLTVGPSESFTAAAVPPGRYFVRLHTVNHTGESLASAEVVVNVP